MLSEYYANQIQATSVTHTATHSNAGSLTHWARTRIKPAFSLSVRFVTAEPQQELLFFFFCFEGIEAAVSYKEG